MSSSIADAVPDHAEKAGMKERTKPSKEELISDLVSSSMEDAAEKLSGHNTVLKQMNR